MFAAGVPAKLLYPGAPNGARGGVAGDGACGRWKLAFPVAVSLFVSVWVSDVGSLMVLVSFLVVVSDVETGICTSDVVSDVVVDDASDAVPDRGRWNMSLSLQKIICQNLSA